MINCSDHRQHPALGEKGGREKEGVPLWKQAHGVAQNDAEPFGIFDDAAEPRSTQDKIKSMIQRIEAMSIEAVLVKHRLRKEANTAFRIQKHEDTLHMKN